MKNNIIILFVVLLPKCIYCQSTIRFHEYSPTSSGWDVIEWNVKDIGGKRHLIKETVDSLNRVVELQFLNFGVLIVDHLCYLANRVTYDYLGNTIIEKAYSGDKPLLGNPCENYYKTVYDLDSQKCILKIEKYAVFDFAEMDSLEISNFRASFSEHKVLLPDSTQFFGIEYYYHSFSKFNGIYPVSQNYNMVDEYFYGNEPETSSIRNGIKYLLNYR